MNQCTAPEFTAQMARTWDCRHWMIYVVIYGATHWPEVRITASAGIPTIKTRTAALSELGFALKASHECWNWIEDEAADDVNGRGVHLIASATVVPLDLGRGATL